MTAIIKKELRTYFNSVIGYAFIGFMTLFIAIYYALINVLSANPDFTPVLSNTTVAFLILVPVVTMRLISEEMRHKTDQLLLTSPTSVTSIVVGKYFAAVLLFLISIIVSILFPFLLSFFGEMPTAHIFGAYIGFFLTGASFIAVGLFISALTENQIVAAVATFALLFLMFISGGIISGLPTDRTSSITFIVVVAVLLAGLLYYMMKNIYISVAALIVFIVAIVAAYLINNLVFDGVMVKVLSWFSLMDRMSNFSLGILNISDIIYYLSYSAAFVFLTITTVEKRRWS